MERYQRLEKIGEGTYGQVYKAKDRISDTIVALKRIPRASPRVRCVPFARLYACSLTDPREALWLRAVRGFRGQTRSKANPKPPKRGAPTLAILAE